MESLFNSLIELIVGSTGGRSLPGCPTLLAVMLGAILTIGGLGFLYTGITQAHPDSILRGIFLSLAGLILFIYGLRRLIMGGYSNHDRN